MWASQHSVKAQRGFSLVELMVVMTVVGVVLASSFVSLRHAMPAHELLGATSKLASELRLARQKAVAENNNYVVTFDPATETYMIWDDDGSDGLYSVGESVRIIQLPDGIWLSTINISASNRVTFRPNGSADRGGLVEIMNDSYDRRQVHIVMATGAVREEGL